MNSIRKNEAERKIENYKTFNHTYKIPAKEFNSTFNGKTRPSFDGTVTAFRNANSALGEIGGADLAKTFTNGFNKK